MIYAADYEVAGDQTVVLHGDGAVVVAGLTVQYLSVPGHSSDSMVYKIGNVLFTGDTITAGIIGDTNSQYSHRLLCSNIQNKLLSQNDDCVLMPGHGPPTTVLAEKKFQS